MASATRQDVHKRHQAEKKVHFVQTAASEEYTPMHRCSFGRLSESVASLKISCSATTLSPSKCSEASSSEDSSVAVSPLSSDDADEKQLVSWHCRARRQRHCDTPKPPPPPAACRELVPRSPMLIPSTRSVSPQLTQPSADKKRVAFEKLASKPLTPLKAAKLLRKSLRSKLPPLESKTLAAFTGAKTVVTKAGCLLPASESMSSSSLTDTRCVSSTTCIGSLKTRTSPRASEGGRQRVPVPTCSLREWKGSVTDLTSTPIISTTGGCRIPPIKIPKRSSTTAPSTPVSSSTRSFAPVLKRMEIVYMCRFCRLSFGHLRDLRSHLKREHTIADVKNARRLESSTTICRTMTAPDSCSSSLCVSPIATELKMKAKKTASRVSLSPTSTSRFGELSDEQQLLLSGVGRVMVPRSLSRKKSTRRYSAAAQGITTASVSHSSRTRTSVRATATKPYCCGKSPMTDGGLVSEGIEDDFDDSDNDYDLDDAGESGDGFSASCSSSLRKRTTAAASTCGRRHLPRATLETTSSAHSFRRKRHWRVAAFEKALDSCRTTTAASVAATTSTLKLGNCQWPAGGKPRRSRRGVRRMERPSPLRRKTSLDDFSLDSAYIGSDDKLCADGSSVVDDDANDAAYRRAPPLWRSRRPPSGRLKRTHSRSRTQELSTCMSPSTLDSLFQDKSQMKGLEEEENGEEEVEATESEEDDDDYDLGLEVEDNCLEVSSDESTKVCVSDDADEEYSSPDVTPTSTRSFPHPTPTGTQPTVSQKPCLSILSTISSMSSISSISTSPSVARIGQKGYASPLRRKQMCVASATVSANDDGGVAPMKHKPIIKKNVLRRLLRLQAKQQREMQESMLSKATTTDIKTTSESESVSSAATTSTLARSRPPISSVSEIVCVETGRQKQKCGTSDSPLVVSGQCVASDAKADEDVDKRIDARLRRHTRASEQLMAAKKGRYSYSKRRQSAAKKAVAPLGKSKKMVPATSTRFGDIRSKALQRSGGSRDLLNAVKAKTTSTGGSHDAEGEKSQTGERMCVGGGGMMVEAMDKVCCEMQRMHCALTSQLSDLRTEVKILRKRLEAQEYKDTTLISGSRKKRPSLSVIPPRKRRSVRIPVKSHAVIRERRRVLHKVRPQAEDPEMVFMKAFGEAEIDDCKSESECESGSEYADSEASTSSDESSSQLLSFDAFLQGRRITDDWDHYDWLQLLDKYVPAADVKHMALSPALVSIADEDATASGSLESDGATPKSSSLQLETEEIMERHALVKLILKQSLMPISATMQAIAMALCDKSDGGGVAREPHSVRKVGVFIGVLTREIQKSVCALFESVTPSIAADKLRVYESLYKAHRVDTPLLMKASPLLKVSPSPSVAVEGDFGMFAADIRPSMEFHLPPSAMLEVANTPTATPRSHERSFSFAMANGTRRFSAIHGSTEVAHVRRSTLC